MDKIKKIPARIEKFVEDHKVGIAIAATSAAWFALNRAALKGHDDFLKEKGLYDEFYSPDEDE